MNNIIESNEKPELEKIVEIKNIWKTIIGVKEKKFIEEKKEKEKLDDIVKKNIEMIKKELEQIEIDQDNIKELNKLWKNKNIAMYKSTYVEIDDIWNKMLKLHQNNINPYISLEIIKENYYHVYDIQYKKCEILLTETQLKEIVAWVYLEYYGNDSYLGYAQRVFNYYQMYDTLITKYGLDKDSTFQILGNEEYMKSLNSNGYYYIYSHFAPFDIQKELVKELLNIALNSKERQFMIEFISEFTVQLINFTTMLFEVKESLLYKNDNDIKTEIDNIINKEFYFPFGRETINFQFCIDEITDRWVLFISSKYINQNNPSINLYINHEILLEIKNIMTVLIKNITTLINSI